MSIASIVNSLQQLFKPKKAYRTPVAERLFETGMGADEVVNNVLALLVGATVELSQCQQPSPAVPCHTVC